MNDEEGVYRCHQPHNIQCPPLDDNTLFLSDERDFYRRLHDCNEKNIQISKQELKTTVDFYSTFNSTLSTSLTTLPAFQLPLACTTTFPDVTMASTCCCKHCKTQLQESQQEQSKQNSLKQRQSTENVPRGRFLCFVQLTMCRALGKKF